MVSRVENPDPPSWRQGTEQETGAGVVAGDTAAPAPAAIADGMHFVGNGGQPRVPDFVVEGETLTISGNVHFECPHCLISREGRVRIESPQFSAKTRNLGQLANCETTGFSISIPASFSAGTTIEFEVFAERNPPVGDWEIDDRTGLIEVEVVTASEAQRRQLRGWGTWVGVGAAGGALLGPQTGRSRLRGAIIGGGVGAGARLAAPHAQQALDSARIQLATMKTTDQLILIGLLGAGAWLLSGATDVVPGQ